jgi:DNA-binding response OmpR family regulator
MTVCKHCSIDSATLQWQAKRIETLEAALANAHDANRAASPIAVVAQDELALTRAEGEILALLLQRDRVTRESLIACYPHKHGELPRPQVINVLISRLRRKIEPLGLTIKNVHGYGYYIPRQERRAPAAAFLLEAKG